MLILSSFKKYRSFSKAYDQIFQRSITDPEAFWDEQAHQIHWNIPYETVLDDSQKPLYKWFKGGQLNITYNCLDRHIKAGRGDQLAYIWDSPISKTVSKFTYKQTLRRVQEIAGALKNLGVEKGDRVVIFMPMIPSAIFSMLACARIGAIHCVAYGGYASQELANRIIESNPKVLITSNYGYESFRLVNYMGIVEKAIHIAKMNSQKCPNVEKLQVVINTRQGSEAYSEISNQANYHDLDNLIHETNLHKGFELVNSDDPLYLLYTSGTTGAPKDIVRDTGGYATALNFSMKHIMGMKPGQVFWSSSDIGWIVGHSFITYGPTLSGNTSILFEGKSIGTPDSGAFWRVCSDHKVAHLNTSPTALRAIKKEDPEGQLIKKYNLEKLEIVTVAGERLDPSTFHWLQKVLPSHIRINDQYWQTESGWPMVSNFHGTNWFDSKPGSATKPVPGYNLQIKDTNEEGLGSLVMKLPSPPGFMMSLWQNNQKFKEKYFDGDNYQTGDIAKIDKDGYVHIMGRFDDIINVSGHRFSTGQMEEVVCDHESVAEAAVVGIHDDLKGQIPIAVIVIKSGFSMDHKQIQKEIQNMMKQKISPSAALKEFIIVNKMPKTRSGKILRGTIQAIAEGRQIKTPPTIEDVSALYELQEEMANLGLGK